MADSWRWAQPIMLWWIVLLPILVILAMYFRNSSRKKTENSFGKKLTPFLTSSFDPKKAKYRLSFEILTLLFIIFAWAQPQIFSGKQKVTKQGIEILFVFDVSNSMEAEDAKPSRLQVAKSELVRFVQSAPNNRYGVIAFAGGAALVSPLTTDPNAVEMYLESLQTNSVSTQGTDFNKALSTALGAFVRGGVDGEEIDNGVTKAIIVVSDGEDHESEALKIVDQLVEKDIRIFTLAVGTEKGAPVPIKDSSGETRGYRQDRSGNTILSSVNVNFLRDMARRGGGSFHQLEIGGDAVNALKSEISKLSSNSFGEGEIAIFADRFQIFLIIALAFGLFELLIGSRRARARIWRGRFEVMES